MCFSFLSLKLEAFFNALVQALDKLSFLGDLPAKCKSTFPGIDQLCFLSFSVKGCLF